MYKLNKQTAESKDKFQTWERIYYTATDKELMSFIYKKSLQINKRKLNNAIKKKISKVHEQTVCRKRDVNDMIRNMRRCLISHL